MDAESHALTRARLVSWWLVVFLVIMFYLMVIPHDGKEFVLRITQYYYQFLTKAMLMGHVSLAITPPEVLSYLSNPYDPVQNYGYREMFDISYFKGKYYLYFGPLPLVFLIPYYWIAGKFATSHTAVLFFVSLGFASNFYLLNEIKNKYFSQISNAQLILAGLALGVCNNSLFLLARPWVYEVAIASTFCFMNFALLFLFKVFNENFKIKDVLLFSTCLALCVAGRPNFALACFTAVPLLLLFFYKSVPAKDWLKATVALLTPMLVVAILLAVYNYERFDSIFEFGMHYQLTDKNRFTDPEMLPNYHNIFSGLYYYFFAKFSSSPWALLNPDVVNIDKFDRVLMLKGYSMGYVKSIFINNPICVFILALPIMLIKNKKVIYQPLFRFIAVSLIMISVIILYTTSLAVIKQRYMTDFLGCLVLLSILTAWYFEQNARGAINRKIIQGLAIMAQLGSLYLTFTV